VVFFSHHYHEVIFSHFLHSYQLLLDEIVTVEPSTEHFLFIFFLTFCVGRLGDDSELLIIWFLVAVWPLGQRIGFGKNI